MKRRTVLRARRCNSEGMRQSISRYPQFQEFIQVAPPSFTDWLGAWDGADNQVLPLPGHEADKLLSKLLSVTARPHRQRTRSTSPVDDAFS